MKLFSVAQPHVGAYMSADHVTLVAVAAERRPRRAAIDRYLLFAGPTAANPLHATAAGELNRRTDGRTDTVPFHRPCSTHYAGCANNQGSFPVRKRTGTLRIWRAREREPIWGSEGGVPSGVQGQSPWSGGQGGESP